MKYIGVVTYRLAGHKDLTVQRFDLYNDVQREEMDKLIDRIRAHAVLDELGRVQYVRPGDADHHQVGFEVVEDWASKAEAHLHDNPLCG